MSKRSGASLMEVLVYGFLLLLLLGGVGAVYISCRDYYQGAFGSYLISSEFEPGMRALRRELKETSLTSIRAYPNQVVTAAQPGVSFISARDYDQPGRFNVSPHGAPQWEKHVFYALQPKNKESGTVVRWEQKLETRSYLPFPSPALPQSLSNPSHSKTMLKGILLAGAKVTGLSVDGHGGFQISFLRLVNGEESLSDVNPGTESEPGGTRLIQVDLKGIGFNDSGRLNYFSLHFRVCPRHD